MIDIDKLKNMYGVALVLVKQTDFQRLGIGELIREDNETFTIRNAGVLVNKPQFNQIVQPDGSLHPLVTVPEGYTDCAYDITGIQSGDMQVVKSNTFQLIELQDESIINLYKRLIGI